MIPGTRATTSRVYSSNTSWTRKDLTFDQLMQPSVNESQTLRELLGAYHAGEL